MLTIKHISLDVWQTLVHSNVYFRKKRNQLLANHFNIHKPFEFIEAAAKSRQAWCTRVNELVGKNIESSEIILMILYDCGVSLDTISPQQLALFYNEMETLFLELPPILIQENLMLLLTDVKNRQITLSLLSNTGLIKGSTLNKFFDAIGLSAHFDFELYSDEIGFSKPNKKAFDLIFEKAKELQNLTPQQIVHIGDNEIADYRGALTCCYQAHLVDHANFTLQHYLNHNVFNIHKA